MIVDFRFRPPVGGYLAAPMYNGAIMRPRTRLRGLESPESLDEPSLEATLREMDAASVDIGVVPTKRGSDGSIPNEEAAALVRLHPERFIAFGTPDPQRLGDAPEEIAEFVAKPEFAGVALEPGLWAGPCYLDDPKLYPIYECCQDLGVPVMLKGGGDAGPDSTYASPVPLDHVAADFPRLTIVATHGGWPWVAQMLHVCYRRPNVYASPDCYIFGMAGWRDYVDAGNGFLQDRLLFGTAYPFLSLAPCVSWYQDMFGANVLPKILGENALRVLGDKAPRSKSGADRHMMTANVLVSEADRSSDVAR
jgi:uncharacterized protein